MSSPAFSFYPGDWRRNSNLMRCTFAAQGAWVQVMCLMHDADRYGTLNWPLKDIARTIGCPIGLLNELVTKGVLKGAPQGSTCEPYVYVPRSGRRDGEPATLIGGEPGPLWYSSRMVRDEYVRAQRGRESRFGEPSSAAPMHAPITSPKPPIGEPKSDGPSVAVASAVAVTALKLPTTSAAEAMIDRELIFSIGKPLLIEQGAKAEAAGSFLGGLIGKSSEAMVAQAVRDALKQTPLPGELRGWLTAATERLKRESAGKPNGRRNPAHIGQQDYSETFGAAS